MWFIDIQKNLWSQLLGYATYYDVFMQPGILIFNDDVFELWSLREETFLKKEPWLKDRINKTGTGRGRPSIIVKMRVQEKI